MPQAGQRVGRYELVRKLGQGGMGQVWEARAEAVAGTRRSFALKLFPPPEQAGDSPDTFMAEARVAMLLTHSGIVQVFEAGNSEEGHYLVMELVDGIDLGKLLKARVQQQQPIEVPTAAFIVAQVLRALHYAHELQLEGRPLQLVHRDVSPQNVMLSLSGEVKLADFGIARTALHSTAGTHIKGKLRYMAPEQLEAGPLTAAADLYAVGVLLHELVSGQRFRRAKGIPELCREVSAAEIPPVSPPVPEALEHVRTRLLAPDPARRFSSAEEALRTLQAWSGYHDCTFEVADLCRALAPAKPTSEPVRRIEFEPTIARADPETAPVIDAAVPPTRSRWPVAGVVAALIVVGVAMSALRPWETRDGDPAVAEAVTADPALERRAPGNPAAVDPATARDAPSVARDHGTPPPVDDAAEEPAPDRSDTANEGAASGSPAESVEGSILDAGDGAARNDADPAGNRGSRSQRKRRRPHEDDRPKSPPTDATVLASIRRTARRACRGDTGGGRIKIDFLIQDDGRPALVRSSAPGDPRSGCVEKKVRAARFASGTSRRSSLAVSFDP